MNKRWIVLISLWLITNAFGQGHNALISEVKDFLKQDWSSEELEMAAAMYTGNNFLQVFPNHSNLTYREGEQAGFVLLLEGQINNPTYQIVARGMFPARNREVELLDTGLNYFYQSPPLNYDDQYHFIGQARIVYAEQLKRTKDYLARLNPSDPEENRYREILKNRCDNPYIVLEEVDLTINVLPAENQPPVAEIYASVIEGYAPLQVEFSGENSYDHDGNITQYQWNFGDNSTVVSTATVSHVFLSSNTFDVKLTVVDDRGGIGEKVIQINVEEDTQLPEIIPEIESGSKVITDTPIFIFNLSDNESGIDQTTGKMFVDGEDVTDKAIFMEDRASIQFTSDWPLSVGSHTIEVKIKDKAQNEKTIRVTYEVDLGQIEQGFLSGTVLDSSGNPLEGASVIQSKGPINVRLRGTTDSEGNFVIPFYSSGEFIIKVSKSGYLDVVKPIELTIERDQNLGIYTLTQVDTQVTPLTVASGGTANNSTGTLSFFVAPGALPYDIDFVGTEYEKVETLPAELPELSVFTYAFDVKPTLLSLTGTSALYLENTLGFPEGASLVYGIFDEVLGRWIDSGKSVMVGEGGKIKAGLQIGPLEENPLRPGDINHPVTCLQGGSLPSCEVPVPNPPPPPPPCTPNNQGGGSGSGGKNSGGGGIACPRNVSGSEVDMDTGNAKVDYTTPSVKRFGETISLKFAYNSRTAYPTFFVGQEIINNFPDPASAVEYELQLAGRTLKLNFSGEAITSTSLYRSVFPGINAEGKFLETGVYSYEAKFATLYENSAYATASYFGAPPGPYFNPVISSRVPLRFRDNLKGNIVLINNRLSPFGSGWSLEQMERLYFSPDGMVALDNGVKPEGLKYTPVVPTTGGKFEKINLDQQLSKKGIIRNYSGEGIVNLAAKYGIIYAADCQANMIYRIDSTGYVDVVAGTGVSGFSGDGGLATKANLNCPMAVYPAELGGFYIADSGNYRIRKVEKNGIIKTIAGNGTGLFGPDGVKATSTGIGKPISISEDNMFSVFFTVGDKVRFINPRGVLETYASRTSGYVETNLQRPSQVIFDDYNYPVIVDKNNNRIMSLYPQSNVTQVLLARDERKGDVLDKIVLNRPKVISYDTKLKRYFILEESGRVLHWEGRGSKRLVEITLKNESLGVNYQDKKISAQQAEDLEIKENQIKAMAYLPSIGLILSDGSDIIMRRTSGNSQKGINDAKEDGDIEYIADVNDTSRLFKKADGTYERKLSSGVVVKYDGKGFMTSSVDKIGRVNRYQYIGSRISKIILPTLDYYEFNYLGNGYLESVIDPAGRKTTFDIDQNGDLLSITGPDFSSKNFTYVDHMLASETKESGETTEYLVTKGRIKNEILPGERPRNFVNGHSVAVLTGNKDDYEEDVIDFFKSFFISKDEQTPIVKPEDLVMRSSSKGGDCESTSTYNGINLIVTDCMGFSSTYKVNEVNRFTGVITPEGREVYKDTFDSLERIIEKISPNGHQYFNYVEESENVSESWLYGNAKTFYVYNDQNLVTKITDPLGYETNLNYNEYGLLTSILDSLDHQTQIQYGSQGNVSKVIDPLDQSVEYFRDDAGNVTSIKDQANKFTNFVYDNQNRLLEIHDPMSFKTQFDYAEDGKLLALTDPKNQQTRFEYDNHYEKVSKIINPAGQEEIFSYDANERLVQKTNKDGSNIVYNYNLRGDLTSKATPMNTTTYGVDGDGMVTSIADNDSQVLYKYNDRGNVSEVKQTHQTDGKIVYEYDNNNQKIFTRFIDGAGVEKITIHYQYTQRNELERIDANFFGKQFVWEASYDSAGRMSAERINNELISSYAFDDLSRITSINHSYNAKVISGQNYAYSPVGNILSRDIILGGRNNPPGIFTESFGYDSLDRVISSSRENGFSYDEVGNRTGSGEVYNNLNQLLSNNDFEFTYTGNGNVATKKNKKTNEVFEFYWDIENQLIQIQIKKNLTELTKTIDYKTDGTGRRIERSVTNHLTAKASYARKYFYDNEDILLEFDENDQMIAAYLHGPGIDRPLAMLRDINKNSSFEDNEIFYYTRDNLGSIRELVNTQGKVVQRYSYGVYGTTRLEKDNPNDSHEFVENPYAYTAREWEQETGLYYYRARFYAPETGRFLSEDPIGFNSGDSNFYRYVGNSPLMYSDPYGLLTPNRNDPIPEIPRTSMPTGSTYNAMECLESCLGGDLIVTGGNEQSGHSPNSQHYNNNACDIAGPSNGNSQASDPIKTNMCARSCGFSNGQYESFPNNPNRDHYHLQITPGNGVPKL